MNGFGARVFGFALFVLLVAAAAVQTASAQQVRARQQHHQAIPAGKTCSSCHKRTYAQWKSSPHGDSVECTVCHGEITAESVAATPALSTCETCHTEQVAQVKSEPFLKGKTCATCHQPHTFLAHPKPAAAGE